MNDEDYKQLIQNYNQKQLIIGWNIWFNLGRLILSFVIIILYIFYDKSYPEFWSVVISRPLLFIFIFIWDNAIKKYPIILDYIFSFLLLIFGLLFTYENIKDPYPKFFEMWYIYLTLFPFLPFFLNEFNGRNLLLHFGYLKSYE